VISLGGKLQKLQVFVNKILETVFQLKNEIGTSAHCPLKKFLICMGHLVM